ncbi:16491_t:CDS:1, partial [Cetraspora pellucida]
TESKKDKELREKQSKQSGVPLCELCNACHWRCKNKKCTNCCNLNKCNDVICDYCKEINKIELCKRSLPVTEIDYEQIKDKVSYIC